MDINSAQLDILKEIGSIGSGQAATSLSAILDKKIDVKIEDTRLVPVIEFTDLVGGADKVVLATYCELSGEIGGMIHLIFEREAAVKMIDTMMNKPQGTTKIIEQMDESAFKEVANILFGSYLSSLSNMLSIKVLFSAPNFAYDLAGAILDFSLIKIASKVEQVLAIKTRLNVAGDEINGNLIVLFDNDALKKIVGTIEEKYMKA